MIKGARRAAHAGGTLAPVKLAALSEMKLGHVWAFKPAQMLLTHRFFVVKWLHVRFEPEVHLQCI